MLDPRSGAEAALTSHPHTVGLPPFPCPVCDSALTTAPFVYEVSSRGEVGITRCADCKLYLTWPRLEEPQAEYMKDRPEVWEAKYGPVDRGERLHDRHLNYLEEVTFVRRYVSQGCILDVGCNAGWLLGYLQDGGRYTLEGLEPSPMLAQITRRRLDIHVHNGYLEDLEGRGGAYSGLIATDVIEHILPEQIGSFVAAAHRVLAPGGHIFIKTPNARFTALKSWVTKLIPAALRRFIIQGQDVWDAKEHVIHWDAQNLARLFSKYGFELVQVCVPCPVQTAGSPTLAFIARRLIFLLAQMLGGRHRVPFFAQDIFLVARKPGILS